MKYESGQIYFWNDDVSFFGKLITIYNKKVFGSSDCTHVGIIAEVKQTEVLIFESTEKGFKSSWYPKSWLAVKLSTGQAKIGECKQSLKNLMANCQQYEGIGYGWLDIIGIGLSFLFGYKVIGITGKNALICSEAVSRVIYDCTKSVNFAEEYGIKYDAVTPMHIFKSKFVRIL